MLTHRITVTEAMRMMSRCAGITDDGWRDMPFDEWRVKMETAMKGRAA